MADIVGLRRLGLAYGGLTFAVALIAAAVVFGHVGAPEATVTAALSDASAAATVTR